MSLLPNRRLLLMKRLHFQKVKECLKKITLNEYDAERDETVIKELK